MKFKFEHDELLYMGGLLRTLAGTPGMNRPLRRHISKLAHKFLPWAKNVHLKPKDRAYLISFLGVGESVLTDSEKTPENEAAIANRLKLIGAIRGKLNAAR